MLCEELRLTDIGWRMMQRRRTLGMTREELATRGGVTAHCISHAEEGRHVMRPANLLKIAAALEVSIDYLLTGDVVDKDLLIMSDKLRLLTPSQLRSVENIVGCFLKSN